MPFRKTARDTMRVPDLTQRAVHATWWSALEISARYGAQFVVMVVLARLLSPADFGLVAMLLVFTSIGALLVDSGFGTALIQRQHTTDDDETTVFLFAVASSTLVALALFVAAPSIAAFYQQPELEALTRVFVLVLPLGAMGAVPDAMLTMKLDFRSRARVEIVASAASGITAIALAWRGYGAWALAWQAIVGMGLRAVLLWTYSAWRPRGRFSADAFRRLFSFGGYMLMTNLLDVVSIRLQSLLIGRLFDSRALGYYTIAQNTQQAPTSFIGSILNRVGLPVFASVAHHPERLLGALRLSLRVSMFLFVPCMLGVAIIARPLVAALYGPRWVEAAPLLAVLALGAVFWPLHVLNLAAISAQGRSDLFFKLALVKKAVAIILIILASQHGPLAIAWATVASSLFSSVVNTHYSRTLLGYGIVMQIADQLGTVLLALSAALAGWAVLHWNVPSVPATLSAVAVAVTVYLSLAAMTHSVALSELLHLLRALRYGHAPRPAPPIIAP
jgi:O-antigen/teichoic acid export membrane protein